MKNLYHLLRSVFLIALAAFTAQFALATTYTATNNTPGVIISVIFNGSTTGGTPTPKNSFVALSYGQTYTSPDDAWTGTSWTVAHDQPGTLEFLSGYSSAWTITGSGSYNLSGSSKQNITTGYYSPPSCAATTLTWGTSNFCQASVNTTSANSSFGITNTKAGATGTGTAVCSSSGTWSVTSPTCTANLTTPASLSASDGTSATSIAITWGAVSGATTYRIQYRVQGTGTWADLTTTASTSYTWSTSNTSTYQFQVRAENAVGSSAYSATDTGYITQPNCAATTLTWGPSNFCSASVASTATGNSLSLTNATAGASGAATASCSVGVWSLSATSCAANLPQPTGFVASDGTQTGVIALSWDAIPGTTTYRVQYRVQGSGTWADLTTTSSTSYNWSTASYSIYEFQLRAENASGNSVYSATDLGWIRPLIDSAFVSQSGIPAKVGVNKTFTFSQVWQNTGSETWTGGLHGSAHMATNGAIQWGIPFTAFAGSTASGANVTQTLTGTAPATPGTYTLQRIMQKSGTNYGTPSTLASIIVVGTPTCTGVSTNVSTTYNPNLTVTVKLAGPSSVESASIKVWGEIQGQASGANYAMTFNGTDWIATFPIASHLSAGETKINVSALVANTEFSAAACASTSVAFEQLPLPVVTLTPTFGSYADGANQGFVVNRVNGEFAKVLVDLGSYSSSLKAKVEVLDVAQINKIQALNTVTPNVQTSVAMSSTTMSATPASWVKYSASVRVTYADADAATQGKVALIPISWTAAPTGLIVNAAGTDSANPTVAAKLAPLGGSYDSSIHGDFTGFARIASNSSQVGTSSTVESTGAWNVTNLDYSQLYATPLVAVARAIAPSGITLLAPLEFISAAFTLPVQRPVSVSATDGTREDDVQVVWPAVATGNGIRYRVFRDGVEITPVVGISSLEYIDTPPVRGTVYTYAVKTMINAVTSNSETNDTGFVPVCRAPRLVGASLNADMTAITGLVERWSCLTDAKGVGSVDTGASTDVSLDGASTYRSFNYTLDPALPDGAHVMHLVLQSEGVTINAQRSYDIPFNLAKASITIKSLTILYDGTAARQGMDAASIGRFGVRMEGGTGLGFAEESQ